jgi:hypothetical protein
VPFNTILINGQAVIPRQADPPPTPPPAPPPPPPPPAPPVDLAAVEAAAAAAAAAGAALLAGGGAAEIATAAQNAGASQDVVAALASSGIPNVANIVVTGSTPVTVSTPILTQEEIDAADAAGRAAGAAVAALLAGGGAAEAAVAAEAAGASPDVVAALAASGIPSVAGIDVTGTDALGGDVGDTDDLAVAAAIANANKPDLTNLLAWDFIDPFGIQTLGVSNPALKGGGALSAIAQACSDYGVDALAAIADALHEGANGGIGDGGLAYGPFQDHLTEYADRPMYGKGRNNPTVNAWAWSENGIRYSVRAMVNGRPSAKGLRGHPAVYAIVYGYEQPADEPGAYKTRAAEYDRLVSLGAGWAAYAAPKFAGPAAGGAVDTTPITGGSSSSYAPAGVTAQWRQLVDTFKLTVPAQSDSLDSLAKSLVEVFR